MEGFKISDMLRNLIVYLKLIVSVALTINFIAYVGGSIIHDHEDFVIGAMAKVDCGWFFFFFFLCPNAVIL